MPALFIIIWLLRCSHIFSPTKVFTFLARFFSPYNGDQLSQVYFHSLYVLIYSYLCSQKLLIFKAFSWSEMNLIQVGFESFNRLWSANMADCMWRACAKFFQMNFLYKLYNHKHDSPSFNRSLWLPLWAYQLRTDTCCLITHISTTTKTALCSFPNLVISLKAYLLQNVMWVLLHSMFKVYLKTFQSCLSWINKLMGFRDWQKSTFGTYSWGDCIHPVTKNLRIYIYFFWPKSL